MSGRPFVSVVVPARHAADHLPRALASVWAQTRVPDECIVVVDPADAPTVAVARADGRATVVAQPRLGLAAARNAGVERCSGAVLTFLDADDEWTPDKTAVQLDALASSDRTTVLTAHMQRVAAGAPLGPPEPALTPSGLMAERGLFERIGPFDNRFRIACDTEWLMRARDWGAGPTILDSVLVHKHVRSDSLSRDLDAYRAEMLVVVREAAARRAEHTR